MIALLNDFRLSQGKSALGFLNPLIYSTGAAGFNDITSGSNPGCGTNGFSAGTGWDPVSAALLPPPSSSTPMGRRPRAGHRPRHKATVPRLVFGARGRALRAAPEVPREAW